MMHFVGIDVSKEKIDVCWLRDVEHQKIKTKAFKNKDFGVVIDWCREQVSEDLSSITVVLEPTGVYHEGLTYALHEAGLDVRIGNPSDARAFAKSVGFKHKTDKEDAKVLAYYGSLQPKNLKVWEPEPPQVRELKAILRRLHALEKDQQRETNRLEASEISGASARVTDSIRAMISALDEEIKRLKSDIDERIKKDPVLAKNRELLQSIKGVGEVFSREMVVLFAAKRFNSAKQVAAYLGLTPVFKESGKLQGKTVLSKLGPANIRSKLYMAAIVAGQHNPDIKRQKHRLIANGKSKMAALGAAMRKLVQICYGVVKNQQAYQPQTV
ncbi:MAG: IS110 family transposase [Firmicutes bacterium]|nr:IS110 family transposase [Bacillota bacterium]